MMCIGMHCRLLGRPGRIGSLQRFLDHVQAHERVWVCRRIDIARHWKADASLRRGHRLRLEMTCALTLDQLNAASQAEFTALLDGTYEHSPWVAEAAWAQRPFASLAQLKLALVQVLREAGRDAQLTLIRAHPELAGKAMVSKTLTAESTNEQGKAGLTDCTPDEFAQIQQLNADYNAKFGFPFILAVRGPRGTGLNKARDHRHLRAPAGQPPRLRARRVPAQHPPHCRDPPGRQVRPSCPSSATWCGTGPSAWPRTATPATPSAASSPSPT